MNLVVVNDFAHVNGGAAQVALSSAMGLARLGHRVVLVAAVAPVDPRLREAGVEVVCTHQLEILQDPNRLRAAGQGLWNFKAARQLGNALDACQGPTVVHLHGWSKALSSSLMGAIRQRRVPAVVTIHDYFLGCPNGAFYNYQTSRSCPLTALSPTCLLTHCDGRSRVHKAWRVGRQVVQRCAGLPGRVLDFIGVSSHSVARLRPYLPIHARLHRVPNPIDVSWRPACRPDQSGQFLYVGRMSPEKGPDLLAQAALGLQNPVHFVGQGPSLEPVRRLLPEARYAGWLPKAEVLEQMHASRALVFPSRFEEIQGMAVPEAAACGLPAIVPDFGNGSELVEEGVSGLLFRSGDAQDLRERLRQLADPALAARLGAGAYQRFWANPPSLSNHLEKLQAVYESML